MSWGVLVQAEYEDGFILTEDEKDISPYDQGRNIFHAIVNSRPCDDHGPMVRFSVITPTKTYSVDWKKISEEVENPRPIYYREMSSTYIQNSNNEPVVECNGHFFGYQYNDENGANMQDVVEIDL